MQSFALQAYIFKINDLRVQIQRQMQFPLKLPAFKILQYQICYKYVQLNWHLLKTFTIFKSPKNIVFDLNYKKYLEGKNMLSNLSFKSKLLSGYGLILSLMIMVTIVVFISVESLVMNFTRLTIPIKY
jgi:hypothetical protein